MVSTRKPFSKIKTIEELLGIFDLHIIFPFPLFLFPPVLSLLHPLIPFSLLLLPSFLSNIVLSFPCPLQWKLDFFQKLTIWLFMNPGASKFLEMVAGQYLKQYSLAGYYSEHWELDILLAFGGLRFWVFLCLGLLGFFVWLGFLGFASVGFFFFFLVWFSGVTFQSHFWEKAERIRSYGQNY